MTNQLTLHKSHKEAFNEIRNFLAGRLIGATRDRSLLEEVVKCIFIFKKLENQGFDSSLDDIELSKTYRKQFLIVKKEHKNIFGEGEELLLDPESIRFIQDKLLEINFEVLDRDFFGDLYESMIGTGTREEEGQFFTPQNGIELLVELVDISGKDKIIDPACGAGGFLGKIRDSKQLRKNETNSSVSIFGVEKDSYLAKLSNIRAELQSFQGYDIKCGNSLTGKDIDGKKIEYLQEGFFDVVLTNPPFGKKIVSVPKEIQKEYDLGYTWTKDKTENNFKKQAKLPKNVPPQILFVEKCLSLLKEGGRLGIVLPESLLTSKSYSFVVQYIRERASIDCVIGMPEEFFKTSGKGGTHTKVCLLKATKGKDQGDIFFAEAKHCGHNLRGQSIEMDDLPTILNNYLSNNKKEGDHLGYWVKKEQLVNNILSPRYYDPEVTNTFSQLKKSHELVKFGKLLENGTVELSTGHEVGRAAYGTGDVPFVRTSDISNWEIKADPKHLVNIDYYNQYSKKQDVRSEDILMVKDGTYLIGTCAMVTKYDQRIIFQSHIYKIRCLDKNKLSPYLLLAILSSDPVQAQIKSKRFTHDIIDSLGSRIHELTLPIPKDKKLCKDIILKVKKALNDRIEARELTKKAIEEVVKF